MPYILHLLKSGTEVGMYNVTSHSTAKYSNTIHFVFVEIRYSGWNLQCDFSLYCN